MQLHSLVGPGREAKEGTPLSISPAARLYLDLLKKCLTRQLFDDDDFDVTPRSSGLRGLLARGGVAWLASRELKLVRRGQTDLEDKLEGLGRPAKAETMMGGRRLDFLERAILQVIAEGVPGDFFEAGCWRGGGAIFMLGALEALGQTDRRVWAADSFDGYPEPTAASGPIDRALWARRDYFAVTRADFDRNVERYGVGRERLRVVEGFFDRSLPGAGVERLALIRIDIDGYEGTRAVLDELYPKLSPGGFVIVDELEVPGCKRAIDEHFARTGRREQIVPVPQRRPKAAYWRKSA
jgi:hypothetical protein